MHHLRRGRQRGEECCRTLRVPSVLLQSHIRNKIMSCKSAKNPYISRAFGTFDVAVFSEIPVNFDGHVSGARNALSDHDFIDQNLHHFACQMLYIDVLFD